jgi:diacylglycerol kinase family enzyme
MRTALRYGIVANPVSGSLPGNRRHALLEAAASILSATVCGLDTVSAEELAQCAREAAERCDVVVVAGGDGTMSLVINAIDLSAAALAFLPFGTGNALTHCLNYRGGVAQIAARIRRGAIHHCDLIDCGGRQKAFMASVGIDGTAIRHYERYRSMGYRGLNAHLRAGLTAVFGDYHPTGGRMTIDGRLRRIRQLTSLMVVKQPYFGMGLKVVPRARWDDGKLHTMTITSGLAGILTGLVTGFTIGNRAGEYRCGTDLTVRLDSPLTLQIDGEVGWTSDRFAFSVLPGVMRLKH